MPAGGETEATALGAFDAVAARRPEAPAAIDAGGGASYGALAALSRGVAAALAAAGGDGPVAILLDREWRTLAAMLGAMRAGRPHLPLDPHHPEARSRLLAELAGATAIVSAGRHVAVARRLLPAARLIDLDAVAPAERFDRPPPGPDEIAYILFTSGSEGQPKAVALRHRNPLWEGRDFISAAGIGPGDRVAFLNSVTVAGSVRAIYGALLAGAALLMLTPQALGAEGIAAAIRRERATILPTVPVLFRRLAAVAGPDDLASIRLAYLTGERVGWDDVAAFRRLFRPAARLLVGLGQTECATGITHWAVAGDAATLGPLVPVGTAPDGKAVAVLGEDGRPAPPGTLGEIAVTSRFLAAGYWRDPEGTARAFVPDPADPSLVTIRTGDLGLFRPDGLLEHHGRRDQQVKLSGFRVELGEVEAALRALPGVAEAAVAVRDGEGGRSLSAYVAGPPEAAAGALLAELAERLPAHMVPARLHVLGALPMLPGLKVDRVRLAELDAARAAAEPEAGGEPEDGGDAIPAELAAIFCEVLRRSRVSAGDSFRALGVDSLTAMTVALEIEVAYGVVLPQEALAPQATLGEIARYVAAQGESR